MNRTEGTVAGLIFRSAPADSAAVALATPSASLSLEKLRARVAEMASGLAALGIAPGDHVGLLLLNGLDFVAAWFGVAAAGAVLVPLNTRYKPPELQHVVANSDLACLLTSDESAGHVDFMRALREAFPALLDAPDPSHLRLAEAPQLRSVVNLGTSTVPWCVGRSDFVAGASAHPLDPDNLTARARPDSLAALVFTSGTTALPKACMHTHEGLMYRWLAVAEKLKLTPADSIWNPLPLFHGTGFGMLMASVFAGSTFITQPHVDPDAALDLIERYRATILYPAFPAVTRRLIEHPRFKTANLSAVRAVVAMGPRDQWRRSQAVFAPAVQLTSYGLQESGGPVTFVDLTDSEQVRGDTCGRPFAGYEVRIADPETGRLLGPGAVGEILVRGPGQFSGYYRAPAATSEMVDSEGFIHTGDHGMQDEYGRVIFKDRIKNMLKVGGENVASAEIETVLLTHPAVAAAVVVGIPHERLDQVPAAFLELRDGLNVSSEEIIAYCSRRLARFKVPRLIRFVNEWPMSATKVRASILRDQLIEELEEGRLDG